MWSGWMAKSLQLFVSKNQEFQRDLFTKFCRQRKVMKRRQRDDPFFNPGWRVQPVWIGNETRFFESVSAEFRDFFFSMGFPVGFRRRKSAWPFPFQLSYAKSERVEWEFLLRVSMIRLDEIWQWAILNIPCRFAGFEIDTRESGIDMIARFAWNRVSFSACLHHSSVHQQQWHHSSVRRQRWHHSIHCIRNFLMKEINVWPLSILMGKFPPERTEFKVRSESFFPW